MAFRSVRCSAYPSRGIGLIQPEWTTSNRT